MFHHQNVVKNYYVEKMANTFLENTTNFTYLGKNILCQNAIKRNLIAYPVWGMSEVIRFRTIRFLACYLQCEG